MVFPIGKIVESTVTFTNSHAFHTHVQPYQITKLFNDSLGPGASYTNYYREGDWHDVLSLQMLNSAAPVVVRLAPGPYGGYGLVHCHSERAGSAAGRGGLAGCEGAAGTALPGRRCRDGAAGEGPWSLLQWRREGRAQERRAPLAKTALPSLTKQPLRLPSPPLSPPCPVIPHEDVGCMTMVKFECPGVPGNAQPYQCPNFKPLVPGTISAEALKLKGR